MDLKHHNPRPSPQHAETEEGSVGKGKKREGSPLTKEGTPKKGDLTEGTPKKGAPTETGQMKKTTRNEYNKNEVSPSKSVTR